jgi:hypothetical protein
MDRYWTPVEIGFQGAQRDMRGQTEREMADKPALMRSFNRDGEADPRRRADFATSLGIDEAGQRRQRRDLASLAPPPHGVNALKNRFPGADGRPDGVRDIADTG